MPIQNLPQATHRRILLYADVIAKNFTTPEVKEYFGVANTQTLVLFLIDFESGRKLRLSGPMQQLISDYLEFKKDLSETEQGIRERYEITKAVKGIKKY